MKKINWKIFLGVFLVILSGLLYYLHFFIFKDLHHIFIYLIGDIAFLPLEVLFVVLIIETVITEREKRIQLEKLSVVINTFFSEVGNELFENLIGFDKNSDKLREEICLNKDLKKTDFIKTMKRLKNYEPLIDAKEGNLNEIKRFLNDKRDFILILLENSTLLENEHFTDLLWATLHLQEELNYRKNLDNLPETDLDHLSNDIKRVYLLLIEEFIIYAMNLKEKYPYLFSLVLRINPLSRERKIEITE